MVLLIALLLITLITLSICEFFLRFALLTRKTVQGKRNAEEEEKALIFLSECEDLWIRSTDGTRLHAYLKKEDSNKYLISLHGYRGSAADNAPFYRYMARMGYNILTPDVRGHGKSGGRWLSMGKWEKNDLLLWIKEVRKITPDARIALHGVSMGGGTVMMASGENPEGVSSIVEDCGYSDVYDEFREQLKAMFHLPHHPILDIIDIWCKIRLGFSFKEIRPAEEVKKTDIPMLFIHGDEDTFVPTRMVYECYENHKGPKDLWISRGVRHALTMTDYKDEYRIRCHEFIERFI